jgi:periplasmic protein TonB
MEPTTASPTWARLLRSGFVLAAAALLTLGCFLVLPVLQRISASPFADLDVRGADTVALPPPPPPPVEEEKEEEKPPEDKPPELKDDVAPLDLSQLELALNPGMGSGEGLVGDTAIKIQALAGAGGKGGDDAFALADLDQKPRPVYQQQPAVNAQMRKRMPATVYLLFTVDEGGRVAEPIVHSSTDSAFDAPALAAIKQWKFEPGKRSGKPVRYRMRQPITFK